jgi:hypothetical protein
MVIGREPWKLSRKGLNRPENARMRPLTLPFRAAIKRLELIERAQVRARSNEKVRSGRRIDGAPRPAPLDSGRRP